MKIENLVHPEKNSIKDIANSIASIEQELFLDWIERIQDETINTLRNVEIIRTKQFVYITYDFIHPYDFTQNERNRSTSFKIY